MDFTLYSTREKEVEKEKVIASLKGGFHYVKQHKIIMIIMLLSVWINLFFSGVVIGSTYIIVQLLEVNSRHFGFIESAGAAGMLAASLYFATQAEIKVPLRFSKINLLLLSGSLMLAVLPLLVELSYINIVIFYIGLYFIFAIFEMGINMPLGVYMQKLIAEDYRGRVLGLMETMAMSMMPIGMLVYGVLFDYLPATGILLVTSTFVVVITLIMLRPAVLKEAHPEFYDKVVEEVAN